jgi:hypothetical protein
VLDNIPAAREVYASLARSSLELLPVKHKNALKRLLNSAGD